MPLVMERVKKCRELRLKSSDPRLADTPHLFREQLNPKRYIAIPEVSSEEREYIPMGWLDDTVIPGSVHMVWVWRVGGRMKSDYLLVGVSL